MAPRTSWKGFLKLSLISVPVKAYTANNSGEDIRLNQLHAECHNRVKYKKVCPEHGELSSDQIVSGYEYSKDQYVIIDPAELDKLRPASDKSVRIEGFVPADAIDSRFAAGRTYYLLPDGAAGAKPYSLLRQGMLDAGVVAIAQVVVSGREQLVQLRTLDDLLVMTVLLVSKKVKDLKEFTDELGQQEMTSEELKLTETLISASVLEDFDYAAFKDGYNEKLSALIQMKVDGEEVVQAPDPEEPKIINLMDALKKSVAEAQAGARKKMAASVKTPSRKTAGKAAGKTDGKTAAGATKKRAPRKRKTG